MLRRRPFQLAALGLALVGYWLPWLTHSVAALRLNGYELSEWITYLPGVRDGSLPLSRLDFLIPLACLALLLGLAATWQTTLAAPLLAGPLLAAPLLAVLPGAPSAAAPRGGLNALLPAVRGWSGWGLLLLSLVCLFTVFPPYPYVFTALSDPEYRAQFLVASLGLVILALALYLPTDLKAGLQFLLAALGAALGLWTVLALRPVAADLLGASWAIGLGWPMMLAGFVVLALGGLRELFGPRA